MDPGNDTEWQRHWVTQWTAAPLDALGFNGFHLDTLRISARAPLNAEGKPVAIDAGLLSRSSAPWRRGWGRAQMT